MKDPRWSRQGSEKPGSQHQLSLAVQYEADEPLVSTSRPALPVKLTRQLHSVLALICWDLEHIVKYLFLIKLMKQLGVAHMKASLTYLLLSTLNLKRHS